jgi:hypothetical protein
MSVCILFSVNNAHSCSPPAVLDDEELPVWMVERNVVRISLKVNLRQRLMVVADLRSVDLQMKALGLLGWSSTDAACIVSLRHSCAWDTVMQVLEEPLYEDIAAGTIVDWAVEFRSYPVRDALDTLPF